MGDIAIYLTIATIIATVSGAVTGLISALVGSRMQMKQIEVQEKQTDSNIESINMSAATQWAGFSLQQNAQLSQMLQECNQARQEQAARERQVTVAQATKDLRIQRIAANLSELLIDHQQAYEKQDLECKFFDVCQRELNRLVAILQENGNG